MSIMLSGHAIGGIAASLSALYLMPLYSWRAVVWVAAIPILFIPIFVKALPESLAFYLLKNKKEKLVGLLKRIDKTESFSANDEFIVGVEKNTKLTIRKLLSEKRALSTIMFWIAAFMCLLVIYGLSTWLPKLMQPSGFAIDQACFF